MPENRHTNLPKTILKIYRTHWRLFWCIMLPVAILAISLDIAQFATLSKNEARNTLNTPSRRVHTVTSNINTIDGITPTIASTNSVSRVEWRLTPIPYFGATDGEGTTWKWEIKFKSLNYGALILLFLTLCPLSLAIACISRDSQGSDIVGDSGPLTAREMWRQTGRKALTVFVATLLFILIVDVGAYLNILISWLIPSYLWELPFELIYLLNIVPYIYFMVTLSLYNPCLILENNSLIGIFRRSHALVSGARFRFLGIYLLTGWIVAVIASVLVGFALLVFSMLVPELAPVREALFSLKFFSLFIGADVEVVLPQVLSTSAMVAILIVKGLIATFLVPIWAILTTRLYLEQVDAMKRTV
ncbi:MAG: hypothetical protein OXI24_19535 [Candidatus Poribacteria bacterium]|nr:hypothetical protein [Candidatus Poribacteria bacterium]